MTTATGTDQSLAQEIEAYLDSEPDPGVPCEMKHRNLPCSEDGMADWYWRTPCGHGLYLCDRSMQLHRLRHTGTWQCRCGHQWPKTDPMNIRRIR